MHAMPTNTQLQKRDTGQTGRIEYKWCSEQILVCERLSHCQRSSKVANIQSHHGPTSQCFESWQKHISNRSKFNMQLVGCRKQSSRKHQNKAENKACKHWRLLCVTKISCFSSTCHYSWLVNERRTSQATSQATTIPCHEPNKPCILCRPTRSCKKGTLVKHWPNWIQVVLRTDLGMWKAFSLPKKL